MLTYESIAIGQRVEVLQKDQIAYGTVLYKGPLVGRKGIWIGIDLTTPDGDNDGSLKGRVYFRAPRNYGIFTTIDNVRLASNIRRRHSRSVYRTVDKKSVVEEELFGNTDPLVLPGPSRDSAISNARVTLSLKKSRERTSPSPFSDDQKRFPLPQTFTRQLDEKKKKERERERLQNSMMTSQLDTTQHTFSPAPSIPRVFMPPSEVDRAKLTGFHGMSIPRYTVVYDQHHFLQ